MKPDKRLRVEWYIKDSYRFTSNPLKDNVKSTILWSIFGLLWALVMVNVVRGLLERPIVDRPNNGIRSESPDDAANRRSRDPDFPGNPAVREPSGAESND
jgi:hypothetical protein